ncbi:MAG: ATP phosphoribosyltransferase regulatory subunit [Lachnospiraceae bacterium]|nr:ATP phosphoribosyltransferase regulatory subunit [Lachnospiraceae bacterium]
MSKKLVHTPEGVRDIYGDEKARKTVVERLLHEKIKGYGYRDIQTPTFEFFDVFSKEVGTTPSKELYKFFDKDGNTLVLRPDFTPSIARCAAKYFMEENVPIRFCYQGNTFTNTSNLQGKLKEVTQMGAELIGDDSVQADAEMIAMTIEALYHAGLSDFQISVGNLEYFKGICAEAGLDEETELELREYISGKNYFGAEELLERTHVNRKDKEQLLKVSELFGTAAILSEAKKAVSNTRSKNAIDRLEKVYQVLCDYGVEKYVSFDLGMLSKYNYYTGIIFKGYTYGVGDAIVKGGRYDNLLRRFGKKAPAIGFVIVIDDLLAAMNRQGAVISGIESYVKLYYAPTNFKEMLQEAKGLRAAGKNVELLPQSYENGELR